MANTRHDAPKPPPRFIGLVRSVRQRMRKKGELRPKGNAYIGGGWQTIILHPDVIPLGMRRRRGNTSQDFHPTKGWGWASRRGKRSNG